MSLWPSRKWDTWRTKAWRRNASTQQPHKHINEKMTKKTTRRIYKKDLQNPKGVQTSESLKRRENLPETAGLHREGPQRSIWSWMPSRPDQSRWRFAKTVRGVQSRKKSWCHPPKALFYHDFTLENHDLEPDAGWWNRNCKGGSNRNIRTCSSFVPGRKLGLTNHPLQALPTMNCNNGWFRVSSLIHPWKWDDDPQLAFIFHSPA